MDNLVSSNFEHKRRYGPVTLDGSTLRTRNGCYSTMSVLCSFYVLLLSAKCIRVRRCMLQILFCDAYMFCRTDDRFRHRIKYVCIRRCRVDPAKCDRALLFRMTPNRTIIATSMNYHCSVYGRSRHPDSLFSGN